MSLDPPANWSHAEQLERGDTPRHIPETTAAVRLASLVGTYIDRRYITDHALQDFAAKVVANRGAVRRILDELDADPKRLQERGKVLRQEQVGEVDSVTWWEEHTGHLKREYEDALAILERVRRGRMSEYDPDEAGARDDDRRMSQARADEKARDGAPRLAG